MITTQGAPGHLLLDARNPLARSVRLRVVSVEYVPPGDAALTLRRVELLVGARVAAGAALLPPGYRDTVTVFFDSAGVSPNRDRYPFRVHVELAGRRLVLLVNVSRGHRHPQRSWMRR